MEARVVQVDDAVTVEIWDRNEPLAELYVRPNLAMAGPEDHKQLLSVFIRSPNIRMAYPIEGAK